jgi:Uma2 family endonuclease
MTIQSLEQKDAPAPRAGVQIVWPTQGQWRLEYLRKLPQDGRRYEIINGTLYVVNPPSYDHQVTAGEIFFHLQRFVGNHALGVVDCAPCGIYMPETAQLVQPDIVFWPESAPAFDGHVYSGVPALVVEVLAPKTVRHDRVLKFDLYEAAGVVEYWLADPAACTVEIYTLSNGEYALTGRYSGDDQVESILMPGLSIRTRLLFSL